MRKQRHLIKWYDQRGWAALLAVVAVVAAYALGLHALDTGSWQQYFLTLLLVITAVNRAIRAGRGPVAKATA